MLTSKKILNVLHRQTMASYRYKVFEILENSDNQHYWWQ